MSAFGPNRTSTCAPHDVATRVCWETVAASAASASARLAKDRSFRRASRSSPSSIGVRLYQRLHKGVARWNKIIEATGIKFELKLLHVAFHRHIGEFRDVVTTPAGDLIDNAAWKRARTLGCLRAPMEILLPYAAGGRTREVCELDRAPTVGIDNQPGDFEYVKIA